MNIRNVVSRGCIVSLFLAISSQAQPEAALTGTNNACAAGPTLIAGVPDTVVQVVPDTAGFRSIFDGTSFKGWWESCLSGHSSADRTYGGIWLIDPANGYLFSNQNTNGAGSILATNKSWGNYELIFDYWPSFGDDGGVFNRTTAAGNCYQTTLDYIGGSSVGGVYFEGGYTGTTRNLDPYTFGANSSSITVSTWTANTANLPNSPCPATGCTAANWTTVFDIAGWNQVRIKFFGTGAAATNKVHNQSWIRKLGAATWVPVITDSVQYATPASYLGFQIHGGAGSWSNRNGVWYRNIKMRPLTDLGVPIPQGTTAIGHGAGMIRYQIKAASDALVGTLDSDHEITVSDVNGRVLERFSGRAGAFRYPLSTSMHGLLLVKVKTARGTDFLRITRIAE